MRHQSHCRAYYDTHQAYDTTHGRLILSTNGSVMVIENFTSTSFHADDACPPPRVHTRARTSRLFRGTGDKSCEMQREEQTTMERQNVDVDERVRQSGLYRLLHDETLSRHTCLCFSARVMQIYPFPLSYFSPLWYRDTIRLFPLQFISSSPPLPRVASLRSTHYQRRKPRFHVSASNVRYRFVIIMKCMDARRTASKKDRKRERQESRKRYLLGMLLLALNDMTVFNDWLGKMMLLGYMYF